MAAMSVGGSVGTIFLNLVSGVLCESVQLDGGWPMVFYLTGKCVVIEKKTYQKLVKTFDSLFFLKAS